MDKVEKVASAAKLLKSGCFPVQTECVFGNADEATAYGKFKAAGKDFVSKELRETDLFLRSMARRGGAEDDVCEYIWRKVESAAEMPRQAGIDNGLVAGMMNINTLAAAVSYAKDTRDAGTSVYDKVYSAAVESIRGGIKCGWTPGIGDLLLSRRMVVEMRGGKPSGAGSIQVLTRVMRAAVLAQLHARRVTARSATLSGSAKNLAALAGCVAGACGIKSQEFDEYLRMSSNDMVSPYQVTVSVNPNTRSDVLLHVPVPTVTGTALLQQAMCVLWPAYTTLVRERCVSRRTKTPAVLISEYVYTLKRQRDMLPDKIEFLSPIMALL